jgi:hypothetical protein
MRDRDESALIGSKTEKVLNKELNNMVLVVESFYVINNWMTYNTSSEILEAKKTENF